MTPELRAAILEELPGIQLDMYGNPPIGYTVSTSKSTSEYRYVLLDSGQLAAQQMLHVSSRGGGLTAHGPILVYEHDENRELY